MSGKIRRLEFDELDARLADCLRPRVERLNYLGEFFKVMGHNPDILLPFIEMTEALKDALPQNLTELGALTVAGFMENEYERNQHERLSQKLGFSRDWIREVNALRPDRAATLSDPEKLAQRFALAALARDWNGARPLFDRLVDEVGDKEAIAYLMLVGRYACHATIVNTLGLAPPAPSIFGGEAAAQ
jgi:alkylhydroperoxidase family enzyme